MEPSSRYIFENVLGKLVNEEYIEEIQTEFPKKSDFDKNYEDNFSVFDYFPRNSGTYCEILSTLTKVANCDQSKVLDYLCMTSNTIIIKKAHFLKNFKDFFENKSTGGSQRLFSKEHFLLLLLFTDVILLIIQTYGLPEDPSNLIQLGLNFAFKYKEICINILLEQWSVIFSIISKKYPKEIFDQVKAAFDQTKKGKRLRFLFTLIRYFHLDTPGFDSDEFVQYLNQIIQRANSSEKSSIFTSLSTLLITYKGDPENLECFYEAANNCWNDPRFNCPGSFDLLTTLMAIMKKFEIEEIKKFCVENIFSHAVDQGMMPTAARVFRNYIWNFQFNPDWIFTGWSPEINDNFYSILNELNKSDTSLFILFEKYFLPSLSFTDCQSLLSDIIVLLSSIDFKYIRKWFKSLYENYGFSDIRIMTMIQTLPKINNPEFSSDNKSKKNDIELFIEEFASRFFLEMYPKTNSDYAIFSGIRKKYEGLIDKSTKSIEKYNVNNHFDFGSSYESVSIFSKKSMQKDLPYNELMEFMPSIVKGGLSNMNILTEGFIVLSASRINKISRPMYQSCLLLLKNPKSSFEFIKRMIEIVKSPRHDGMICNCLKLLKKALDEPLDDIIPQHVQDNKGTQKVYTKERLLHSIEFSAFIGLTSENPFVRIIAFKLLTKVNRSLMNEGLYALIDDHWDSIESDVRNYIFNHEYLKTPKKGKLYEEMFDLETCLRSRYQVPWLYFLAEFCRLIRPNNMTFLWRKIAKLAKKMNERGGLKESNISKSFHQGLFVVFAITAINEKRIKPPIFFKFLTEVTDNEKEEYYNDVISLINTYCSSESHNIFYVFRHLNYTIIPDLLSIIFSIGKSSSNTSDGKSIQVVRTFYSMIRTLDENECLTPDVIRAIKKENLLIKLNQDLIKMTNDWEVDIKNYITKKEREKKGIQQLYKGNMKLYKILLRSFLLIIQILLSKESINSFYKNFGYSIYSIVDLIVLLLEKSTNHKVFKYIKKLSSDILIDILNVQSLPSEYLSKFKEENDYLYFLETISKCELYKKKVLKVLLRENLSFLYYYVLAYFRATVEIYPLYFSAIYEIIVKDHENVDVNDEMYYRILNLEQNKLWGYLFLLALFRMKTGGKRAEEFLRKLNKIYRLIVWSPKNDLEEFEIDLIVNPIKVPTKHYGKRIAESIVIAGQKELKCKKYSRSLKVMVDVLLPFIGLFEFYPNYYTCIPSQSEKKGDRLPKKVFLDNLMDITFIKTKVVNGFDKVLKLWMNLLKNNCHQKLVFWYIFNYENPENPDYTHNKIVLLNALMKKYPYNVIDRLGQMCHFSFYAFCTYQKIKDYEDEFWVVDVLTEAIEMLFNPNNQSLLDNLYNYMPIFIHYALLFHANQTTKLLIKLCAKYEVPYSKMALSSDTLQRVVSTFQKRLQNEQLKEIWKREAMRWVVGCNKLKYAHTSLIILNALESKVEFESPLKIMSSTSITGSTSNNNLKNSSNSIIKDIKLIDTRSKSKDKLNEIMNKPIKPENKKQKEIKDKEKDKKDDENEEENGSESESDTDNENEVSKAKEKIAAKEIKNANDNDNKAPNSNDAKPSNNENNEKIEYTIFEDDDDKNKNNGMFNDCLKDIQDNDDETESELDIDEDEDEENLEVNLLKGVMKSTAYFLENYFFKDTNEVYEFIDDTFQLFNRYFHRNENAPWLCYKYLKAFLANEISIDNYFPEMNALFESCFNSKETGEKATNILPNFFRPLLHVLESDSDAKRSFEKLVNEIAIKGQSVIDIELVQAALNRNDEKRDPRKDEKIIFGASLIDLNRVLGHYASMIDNSSPDLKKRIFYLSTLIIEKYQKFKESRRLRKLESSSSASSLYTLKNDNTKSQVSQSHQTMSNASKKNNEGNKAASNNNKTASVSSNNKTSTNNNANANAASNSNKTASENAKAAKNNVSINNSNANTNSIISNDNNNENAKAANNNVSINNSNANTNSIISNDNNNENANAANNNVSINNSNANTNSIISNDNNNENANAANNSNKASNAAKNSVSISTANTNSIISNDNNKAAADNSNAHNTASASKASKGKPRGSQIKIDSGKNQPKSPNVKNATQIMSSEFSIPEKSELNMQYIVQIFNAAVRSLPDNKDAMNFIIKINEINPLVSTISFNDVSNININVQNAVEALHKYSKQDNDIVTLTDCTKISSASNLIDALYVPSILPFTSEMSLLYNPEKSFKTLFDKWGLILKCIAGQILKKSIEKKEDEIKFNFSKLEPPVSLIPDEKMKKYEQEPLLTIDQFLQL